MSSEGHDIPAAEGGSPVRDKYLPFFVPDIGKREIAEVTATLEEGWLTYGPRTRLFTQRFADHVGASHAVATSSCTAALFLSLKALGVGPGDEVITSGLTFTSAVHVILHCGAVPVLADIEETTFGPDPEAVERSTTSRSRALVAIHYGGQACLVEPLLQICRAGGMHLVEDAAHAFDATLGSRAIGVFGDATCFSFYATKNITTGEGGMVTTNDGELAERIALLGFHGLDGDAWQRYEEKGKWFYEVLAPGYKCNLTDMASAIGLVQLDRADEIREKRREVATAFLTELADLEPWIDLPSEQPDRRHTWHLFPIRLRLDRLTCSRDRFIHALAAENIGTSVHFIPVHRHAFYREFWKERSPRLPRTEDFYSRCVSLPIYSRMTAGDAADVIEAVRKLVRYYSLS